MNFLHWRSHRSRRFHYNCRLYPDGRLCNRKTVPENRSYWNLKSFRRSNRSVLRSGNPSRPGFVPLALKENRSYWNLWDCHRNLQNQIQGSNPNYTPNSPHCLFCHNRTKDRESPSMPAHNRPFLNKHRLQYRPNQEQVDQNSCIHYFAMPEEGFNLGIIRPRLVESQSTKTGTDPPVCGFDSKAFLPCSRLRVNRKNRVSCPPSPPYRCRRFHGTTGKLQGAQWAELPSIPPLIAFDVFEERRNDEIGLIRPRLVESRSTNPSASACQFVSLIHRPCPVRDRKSNGNSRVLRSCSPLKCV